MAVTELDRLLSQQLQLRPRVLVPPVAQKAAHLAHIIKAVLLEVPGGWEKYHALLNEAATEAPGIEWPTEATTEDLEKGLRLIADTPWPAATAFGQRYLLGFGPAENLLRFMVGLDALGLDPLALDRERAAKTTLWGLAYGPRTTREQRRMGPEMVAKLRTGGWRFLDEPTELHRARVWVRARIVEGQLTPVLEGMYGAAYGDGMLSEWSRLLRPFDEAIGWQRRPGHPPGSCKKVP